MHGVCVAVCRLLHGIEDLPEPGLGARGHGGPLPGVLGEIEEQRRVVVGDEAPVAEAHVCEEAAIGALGGEVGREEKGLPDG